MSKYLQVTVEYRAPGNNDSGSRRRPKSKLVKELIVFDALSFTEAEARAIEYMKPYISESSLVLNKECQVTKIQELKINEIISHSEGFWFKVTVESKYTKENGKEVRTPYYLYIEAADLEKARKQAEDYYKGGLMDIEIIDAKKTKILDIIPYCSLEEMKRKPLP